MDSITFSAVVILHRNGTAHVQRVLGRRLVTRKRVVHGCWFRVCHMVKRFHCCGTMRSALVMRISEPDFTQLKDGRKFVAGRLAKGKWQARMRHGDRITIVEPESKQTLERVVNHVVTCNNFRELHFLYGDAMAVCHSDYSEDDLATHDVVGFIFRVARS